MSAQNTAGYRCNMCGMILGSLSDLDTDILCRKSIQITKYM